MERKVKIELTPYNALAILSFCLEFINEDTKGDIRFKAIQDAVEEYEKEIYKKVDIDQLEDAVVENSINKLTGKWPIEKRKPCVNSKTGDFCLDMDCEFCAGI